MKNQYLQLTLLLLAGFLFLAGCAQLKTAEKTEQKISPVVPSPPPQPPPPLEVIQPPPPPPEVYLDDPPPVQVEEKPFTHKVRWPGETLNRISWWYTGSGRNWPAIIEVNPALDPRRIMIGDLIKIPRDLLKTQEPMTREYRTPGAIREKLEEISPAPQPPPPQTVELFGPIDSTEQNTSSGNIETDLPLESLE